MPGLASTAPEILRIRRELFEFAAAVFTVVELAQRAEQGGAFDRNQWMLALSRVQATATRLGASYETSDVHAWASAVMARQGPYRRVLGNLAGLAARPTDAAEPIGPATAELAAGIFAEWSGSVASYLEHRSQLGDAALAALAFAPAGMLRALGLGLVAAAPEELIDDAAQAAAEGAAELASHVPWWAWAIVVGLALTVVSQWIPRRRRSR